MNNKTEQSDRDSADTAAGHSGQGKREALRHPSGEAFSETTPHNPCEYPHPAPIHHGGSGAAHSLQESITVLHIDDDPNDTALLQAAARKANVNFLLQNVGDGDQAVAYLAGSAPYDDRRLYPMPFLVLLDLKMPRSSGFEVLKWIRKHPRLNWLPVVILSGSEMKEDICEAYGTGANSYLVKPIGFEALVSLVHNIGVVWQKAGPRPVI
ncbi:MAG TPA: response regulator [Verrucomicrobiae bacterium]|nr:response regulator [Verrucomicrobiae bacterium]